MIEEAEAELGELARSARLGRFQLEAAIQSVHAERTRSGRTDWEAIAWFYDRLVELAPTTGARVGRAAAIAEVEGAAIGLVDARPDRRRVDYRRTNRTGPSAHIS